LADSMIVPALRRAALLIALAATALVCMPAVARAVVVSFTFDDGIQTQYDSARPVLNQYGWHGTFYVNSGTVQTDAYYMSWSELATLAAQGQEIGGHTVDHMRLDTLTAAQAHSEICDDAAAIRAHGLVVNAFAYPNGVGYNIPAVRSALAECGYTSARTYGELRGPDYPTSAVVSESIPPADPYHVRTPGYQPNPISLQQLKDWVTQAEPVGGWVPLVFHNICGPPCPDPRADASSVSAADFAAFAQWLNGEVARGAVEVKTVRAVISPPPPPEPPQPVRAFKDTATAFASLKVRKRQRIGKLYVTAAMIEGGTLSASATVSVPNVSRVFKFKRVTKPAVAGKRVKLRLRISKKGLRAAKRALRRHKRLKAKITITATDAVGNSKSAKRTVKLRR
jgi:peptidoglycan/xylan/chitin deacetylase (PgdA/CDA1 family)